MQDAFGTCVLSEIHRRFMSIKPSFPTWMPIVLSKVHISLLDTLFVTFQVEHCGNWLQRGQI